MVFTIRATASGPRAAMPAVITAWPVGRLRRNSSLSARMRAVLGFIISLDLADGVDGEGARAAGHGPSYRGFRSGVHRAWLHQRDGAEVPYDVWVVVVVTPFQGQRVAVAGEDDGLPPAVPSP